jgi:hypothetical protein
MASKKIRLQWLALLILAILATLLIWQFAFRKEIKTPARLELETKLTQSSLAKATTVGPATINPRICNPQAIHIESGDFEPVDQVLDCILKEYMSAATRKDKTTILSLDQALKNLVLTMQPMKEYDKWKTFWNEKYPSRYKETIGVSIDDRSMHYDGRLQLRAQSLAEYDSFKQRFDQINAAYLAIPKTPEKANIEKLYELDEQLEKLVTEVRNKFDRFVQFPKYPDIGFYVADGFWYYGKIRQEADKLLPPEGFIDPKTGKRIEVKGDTYSRLKARLEDLYQAYQSLKQVPEDAEKLYEISEKLGKTVEEIHKSYPGSRSQAFWDDKYEPLGLYIGHYSDQLDYDGKLVVDSYRLNPNSRYGEATLVAAIAGAGDSSELSGIPDIGLANKYLEKYPGGKHSRQVYSILATFYQNLYEELLAGVETPPIKYCYNKYLSGHPEDKDREVVRAKAISYYKKLLAFEPAQEGYKKALSNLENRIDGNTRYWCTD